MRPVPLAFVQRRLRVLHALIAKERLTVDALEVFILQLAQLVLAFIEYYEWVREPSLSAAYSGY